MKESYKQKVQKIYLHARCEQASDYHHFTHRKEGKFYITCHFNDNFPRGISGDTAHEAWRVAYEAIKEVSK